MVNTMDELRKIFQNAIKQYHNSNSENAVSRDREQSINNAKENPR